MAFSRLPLELVHNILASIPYIRWLFACIWVCRTWRSIAVPLLLNQFTSLDIWYPRTGRKQKGQNDAAALATLFTSIWPLHTHAVQSITIHTGFHNKVKEILQVFTVLPKFHKLNLLPSSGGRHTYIDLISPFDPAILSTDVYPRLTTLTLYGMEHIPLDALLRECSQLIELSITCYAETLLWELSNIPAVHPLQTLNLESIVGQEAWLRASSTLSALTERGCRIQKLRVGRILDGVSFPKTISTFVHLHVSLKVLDLGSTIYMYSLPFLASGCAGDFHQSISAFDLKSFPFLTHFHSTIRARFPFGKLYVLQHLETATFYFDWLASQVTQLPSQHPLEQIIMNTCFQQHFYTQKEEVWKWDKSFPADLPRTWPDLEEALVSRRHGLTSLVFDLRAWGMGNMDLMEEILTETFLVSKKHGILQFLLEESDYEWDSESDSDGW
ncbi:hypothetical protein DL96DRAFT_1710450 [Flagelloscypha sp. PMI_526]|nr:hypothetical protein DL96DRAFT_1710450 [Flagelloscypha sp. PMI_526]